MPNRLLGLMHTRSIRGDLHVLLIAAALSLASAPPSFAAEHFPDISKWTEVQAPPASKAAERAVWSYAANYSDLEWRVTSDRGQVRAALTGRNSESRQPRPDFIPIAGRFRGGSAFVQAEDGWLVGFNQGEFGAALYWFSRDGKTNYWISDHQVVGFVSRGDALYAIEGLAHLSLSRGSLIGIWRPDPVSRWQARVEAELPFAPYAVSLLKDGTFLIALSDSLIAVDTEHQIRTLLANAPWSGLYPNSSVLADDQSRLYIGMRQFVGEYDLRRGTLRLLVPSPKFLNVLPAEEIERVRIPFGQR